HCIAPARPGDFGTAGIARRPRIAHLTCRTGAALPRRLSRFRSQSPEIPPRVGTAPRKRRSAMFDFDVVTGPTKKLPESKRRVAPPRARPAERRAPPEPATPAPAEAAGVGEG